jgi:hypothetical protein
MTRQVYKSMWQIYSRQLHGLNTQIRPPNKSDLELPTFYSIPYVSVASVYDEAS